MKTQTQKGEQKTVFTDALLIATFAVNVLIRLFVSIDALYGAFAYLAVGITTVFILTLLGKRFGTNNGWAILAYSLYVISAVLPIYKVPHAVELTVFVVAGICALVQIAVWADKPVRKQPN